MDQSLLNHLLQLAATTGDRIIVVDPATREPFVLMGLPQYEVLLARSGVAGVRAGTDRVPMPTAHPFAAAPMVPEGGIDLGALAREREALEHATGVPAATGAPSFAPEPMTAALPDDDRFYVEPLE